MAGDVYEYDQKMAFCAYSLFVIIYFNIYLKM